MTNRRLTPSMERVIDTMRWHGGALLYWPGGFWTYLGCPVKTESWPTGKPVPVWWVTTGTIKALVRRQCVKVTKRDQIGNYPTRVELQ